MEKSCEEETEVFLGVNKAESVVQQGFEDVLLSNYEEELNNE